MQFVSRSRFRVSGFGLIAFVLTAAVLWISCTDTPSTSSLNQQTDNRESIGNTGYSIQLLPGYTIEPDTVFDAWYFKPTTPDPNESEAGFYVGPHPDTAAPPIAFTKSEIHDVFLGDSVTWIEYKTEKYTQRETFIDLAPDKKIHTWCYSRDPSGIEPLFTMIKSIK